MTDLQQQIHEAEPKHTQEAWAVVDRHGRLMDNYALESTARNALARWDRNYKLDAPHTVVRIPPLPMEPAQ